MAAYYKYLVQTRNTHLVRWLRYKLFSTDAWAIVACIAIDDPDATQAKDRLFAVIINKYFQKKTLIPFKKKYI